MMPGICHCYSHRTYTNVYIPTQGILYILNKVRYDIMICSIGNQDNFSNSSNAGEKQVYTACLCRTKGVQCRRYTTACELAERGMALGRFPSAIHVHAGIKQLIIFPRQQIQKAVTAYGMYANTLLSSRLQRVQRFQTGSRPDSCHPRVVQSYISYLSLFLHPAISSNWLWECFAVVCSSYRQSFQRRTNLG